MPHRLFRLLSAALFALPCHAASPIQPVSSAIASRSFVDTAQIVSRFTTEQYAHQSALRIVKGIGYAVYQANDLTPDENKAGQVARMAIFNILAPAATARWIDLSSAGDSSNDITIAGRFVAAPMLHQIGDDTLRIFFTSRIEGETEPLSRVFYKDFTISTGRLSGLHQARCTIARNPGETLDLTMPSVQRHLDFLFGPGVGATFAKGINPVCDFTDIDGQMYGTIQIKNSADGKTLLLTNVLMRSADKGATWDLLGAPDPRQLPGEIKILAEPALTHDKTHIYLHLRSNVVENGYVLSKTAKKDLYAFDAPVKKWTFGIGRPSICDFGKPIGVVAMFTGPTFQMGVDSFSRNSCDVVCIDRTYQSYTRAFSLLDANALNTPFMHFWQGDVYVTYSNGRRRLLPKFGTSEILFTRLRHELFFGGEPSPAPENKEE